MTAPASHCYVYYCSGHGYGHATRVSAFASQLLSLPEHIRPTIHIVSSAPKHVFSDSVERGALYRYADHIDPIIVQPLAYRVDRQKSVDVLNAFLKNKDAFLQTERDWLVNVDAKCVLSDAAFLGCLAAKAAGVPSILVTNFTFDSVYSYLATSFIDGPQSIQPSGTPSLSPDTSIPHSILEPLVSQVHAGYRCADLLLLLPGHIPIPSFSTRLALPATDWVDTQENRFLPEVLEHLSRTKENPPECDLHDHIPFPPSTVLAQKSNSATRQVQQMPLLVRPPSSSVERSPYTPEGRSRLLESAGVPPEQHDPETTKILVVSFGGQVLKWPGRRSSVSSTQIRSPQKAVQNIGLGLGATPLKTKKTARPPHIHIPQTDLTHLASSVRAMESAELVDHRDVDPQPSLSPRLATASHIWIPGAPPALNPLGSPLNSSSPRLGRDRLSLSPLASQKENEPQSATFTSLSPSRFNSNVGQFSPLMEMVNLPTSPRVPVAEVPIRCRESEARETGDIDSVESRFAGVRLAADEGHLDGAADHESEFPQLLPDFNWIVIVCGASKEQREDTSDLPENFYLAPNEVYMPDLTAVADVLLGKLGYGTVSECIDAGTPMVYVSRPLFIEELGLRVLLDNEGVGVEMSRAEYEGGRWMERVKEAWEKGRVGKDWRRRVEEGEKRDGAGGMSERETEVRIMARNVVDWVEDWWNDA